MRQKMNFDQWLSLDSKFSLASILTEGMTPSQLPYFNNSAYSVICATIGVCAGIFQSFNLLKQSPYTLLGETALLKKNQTRRVNRNLSQSETPRAMTCHVTGCVRERSIAQPSQVFKTTLKLRCRLLRHQSTTLCIHLGSLLSTGFSKHTGAITYVKLEQSHVKTSLERGSCKGVIALGKKHI